MATGKDVFAMVTLAATACQPASALEIGIPGARPITYEAIRDTSGVLGYAEPLLGPAIATKYQVPVGAGASAVAASAVAGAWELPLATQTTELAETLRAKGVLERVREHSDGQIWIADYQGRGESPVRLMLINGAHPAFKRNAAPEVRPGAHVYLIAYRKP